MSRYIFTVYLNKKRKKRNFACMLLTILSIFAPNNFRYLRSNSCVFRLVIKDLISFSKNSPIIPDVRIIQSIYFGTLIQIKAFQVNLCCLNRFMPQWLANHFDRYSPVFSGSCPGMAKCIRSYGWMNTQFLG